jgi:UDP-N-acetylmuramoyl-tripeptide--D-alanyl-D-alanine ligase
MPSDLQKCIILGAMMELGEQSKALHEEILQLAIAKKFESILTVGQQYVSFFEGQHLNFENTANLKDYLGKHPIRNKCVLVKGSRTNQLEQIKDLI